MRKTKGKTFFYIIGLLTGIANGLFGSGGGMIAVPMLEKGGLETKKAHATSIALTLPLSIVSGVVYYMNGNIDITFAIKFIPLGLAGVFVGSLLMRKMKSSTLRRIFAIVMIYFGVRLFFR